MLLGGRWNVQRGKTQFWLFFQLVSERKPTINPRFRHVPQRKQIRRFLYSFFQNTFSIILTLLSIHNSSGVRTLFLNSLVSLEASKYVHAPDSSSVIIIFWKSINSLIAFSMQTYLNHASKMLLNWIFHEIAWRMVILKWTVSGEPYRQSLWKIEVHLVTLPFLFLLTVFQSVYFDVFDRLKLWIC